MAHPDDDRKALGLRLAAARKLAGLGTIQSAADALTNRGFPITKQAVGAWEVGRNLPDALWLRRLAKLYGTTVDALVWDDALSIEAIRIAAQFDALDEPKQETFKAIWAAYAANAAQRDAKQGLSVPAVIPSDDEAREDESAKRSLANPPHVNVPAKANKLRRS